MTHTFGPYTPIRQAGNIYFVSGQVGVNPDTKTASENLEAQTTQALDNLKRLLHGNDLDMKDIVKTTLFVTDISSFATVNAIYEQYFSAPRPARSTIEVAGLPQVAGDTELLIEIEAVAYKELVP